MPANTFNIDDARAQFPALGGDQVYLDNAGGSQTLRTVADLIHGYLVNTNVQLGASYAVAKKSTRRYAEGIAAAAKYVNASAEEIVLGPSCTQLFRNVSNALHFSPGDELVISALDHEANIAPWVDLAARQNLLLKWWRPSTPAGTTNPKLLVSDLQPLLSARTRLVTCTHASNILGTIHDVAALATAAHAASPAALVCIDAVAYAPHRAIDVRALGVDLYAFSWYKVYGPHVALLYASPRATGPKTVLRPLGHFFNPADTLEQRLGLAGASYELVAGLPAVVEYVGEGKRWEGMVRHEGELQETFLAWLNERRDVTVWGEQSADPAVRVPTVSFTVDAWNSRELVEAVEKETNFGFRWGCFYSVRLTREILGLGDDGVVRVSMVHYNTVDEVKGLIAALEKALAPRQ